ncbi:MAG TPA: DUF177 domain-containing protein, partial [Nitrospirae bacterium]|nr:DUF177 domain-containing protein [Nitrospirota bacterium]
MRLTVSSIPETGIEEEFKLPVTLGEVKLEKDAGVTLKASRLGDRVFLSGRIRSEASLECCRCLKNVLLPLDINFDVEYVLFTGAGAEEEEHELTSEELDVGFCRDGEINIDDIVREQVLLAVPMKPLCGADCKGICSGCGTNLNVGSCECGAEEIDPRLAPLEKLKKLLMN